ncbi:MAG: MgtC/SapB family protein, partial [Thermoleophilia bacterium]|nr:MgtC/SapB family protein [Thermoleophilia bacterium]
MVVDVVIRILLATVLGGLIGIEREIREHTAGFRTHILVSVGAAAFTLASSYGLAGTGFDPNRISAQIVSGIGFLGAGAIIRHGVSVRGLTTAASLWAVAAVGLTVGQGYYAVALATTAVVIISLYVLRLLEDRFLYPHVGAQV